MTQRLAAAKAAHKKAAGEITAAAQEAFPLGAVVSVIFGKSTVVGRVTGHSDSWWWQPGRVQIRNIRTGKTRYFSATYEGHEAVVMNDEGSGR